MFAGLGAREREIHCGGYNQCILFPCLRGLLTHQVPLLQIVLCYSAACDAPLLVLLESTFPI
eukprot:1154870-Pelagomonas_calceolata.AAC.3